MEGKWVVVFDFSIGPQRAGLKTTSYLATVVRWNRLSQIVVIKHSRRLPRKVRGIIGCDGEKIYKHPRTSKPLNKKLQARRNYISYSMFIPTSPGSGILIMIACEIS